MIKIDQKRRDMGSNIGGSPWLGDEKKIGFYKLLKQLIDVQN